MQQEYAIETLLQQKAKGEQILVDVRSPQEYKEATIPGAVNIPVFDDQERAEVGTLYKQESPEAAKQRGLEIFSDKLPTFIKAFQNLKGPVTVFCWRGGMRSKTAVTVLDLMGIRAGRLKGGIRSYRQWVVETLKNFELKPKLIVLNGYTGVGKTRLLSVLQQDGLPTIDLEALAGHRGSIFGQIGLAPNNQKKFDALFLEELLRYQDKRHIVIEGESKRIGKILLPDFFYQKKENGKQIFIHMPIEERVANIMEDYQPEKDAARFLEAYQFIKKRIHTPIANKIQTCLEQDDFPEAVALLLEYYYDPRYEHAMIQSSKDTVHINAKNVADAYKKLQSLFQTIPF